MDLAHIRAVCWDWNGTLLDDAEICRQVMNAVLIDHGHEPLVDLEAYRSVFRFPIRDFYRSVGIDDDRFIAAATTYLDRLASRVGEARLHVGARDTIAALNELGVRQILASATVSNALERQMAPHDLTLLFETVLAIDDPYRASKHEVIRGWLTASDLDPQDVLLVGDTNHDREIADDLGASFIHFRAGHQVHLDDAESISALDELPVLFGLPREKRRMSA
ncbi:HAD family hydrolase [Microbacterium sp. SA39]|uniref:HAD family hydrolase n=1 Tax=Microbacterium sp. SA39 TaxID=1263625 RepID=UPI00061E7EDF|nr:HAD hydrolase-like protein [Microbacterium sp. SA39]KJQ55590.1 Phosphoglycolate phosphatase [Microbacterium sp. SA39]